MTQAFHSTAECGFSPILLETFMFSLQFLMFNFMLILSMSTKVQSFLVNID